MSGLNKTNADIELLFHGAAQEVTGSMHILRVGDKVYSLDCGLFQGKRTDARQKNEKLPLRGDQVDGVLLSHAHMDHSGNLPSLVKRGFSGPIWATGATCDLGEVMLADSAHIQEEDARFWNEKRAKSPKEYIDPLYDSQDVIKTQKLLRPVEYNKPIDMGPNCRAWFLEAGHILGSACILVEARQNGRTVRLLFTGDLGRFGLPILRDPANPLPKCDYLITESTYADKRHSSASDMKDRLTWIITQTVQAGGKVIIPSFSVGRTQHVVYFLAQAMEEGLLDPLPIYVDSPLSTNATEIFKKHPELYDEEAREFYEKTGDLFGTGKVTFITDVATSKSLNERKEPMVIVSSSGMCEAGRILHHLKNNIEDEANTVVIIGFQAQHTLGRRIVERREELKIYGRYYRLLCRVETLNGFSAHADRDDFARLLGPLGPNLKASFVVHGEGSRMGAMQDMLRLAGCRKAIIPERGQSFAL